jgi:transposase
MKKSEIVNHFEKEGYPRRTIYDAINRLQNEESIEDKKKTGRPTSWTSTRKNQLKKLTNNRKGVSQRRLGRKFNVSHVTFCRQLSKMTISCLQREKTPKYTEKQAEKAKNLCKKLADILYRSSCCVILENE